MNSSFGIYWAGISWWIAALLFVVALCGIWWRTQLQLKTVKLLASGILGKKLLHNSSPFKIITRSLVMSLGILSVCIALMQPQWGQIEQKVQQQGRDVMVLLDISRSMMAQDVSPNRMALAKIKIRNLVSLLDTERVGLILFSGTAVVQCPLTKDLSSFLGQLEAADAETISSGTTVLGKALNKAAEVFKKVRSNKNKIVLIVTDGEDFSQDTKSSIDALKSQSITLLSLGVATPEGGPIPKLDASGKVIGHETDASGGVILSKLNQELLQSLAASCNGTYTRISKNEDDIYTLHQAVQRVEKEEQDDRTISLYHDQYPWFLAIAWICFMLEWIL